MPSFMFLYRVDGYKKDRLFFQIRYHDIFLVIHLFVLNVLDPYFTIKPYRVIISDIYKDKQGKASQTASSKSSYPDTSDHV
jgi:hypothetical protein